MRTSPIGGSDHFWAKFGILLGSSYVRILPPIVLRILCGLTCIGYADSRLERIVL